ncbi:hypothetical protein Rhopal_001226-T1 [Rhodotorula paludigena]|uniref:F-box domain-containing protein n=1 Tax=Rhodotorula paludigena TaxID=86838 RepID=A0AAV5G6T6_9BASI|nr:hypothetical protein Rhopal_001226-T1 [Rhodotorula paludigena]
MPMRTASGVHAQLQKNNDQLPSTTPITKLPEEVLDLIVSHFSGPYTQWFELETLRSWCLTCHAFVASGRRALYRSPSKQGALTTSRDKAYTLLQTLKQHPHLPAAVRELNHLAGSVECFSLYPPGPFASAIHRSIVAFEWQNEMLRLCSQVTRATVALGNPDQARELAELLVAGRVVQHLECRFVDLKDKNEHAVVRALARGLGGTTMPRMDTISLHLTRHVHTANVRPHYVTRKLKVDVSATCLLSAAAYLPKGITGLRSLEIRLGRNKRGLDFQPFLAALSTNYITHFELRPPSDGDIGFEGAPEFYAEGARGPALPLALFGTFKHLRKLDLRACSAMDVARLSLLADSSGATLTHLDLRQTYWAGIAAADFESTNNLAQPTPFEERVMQTLERMPRLKSVSLGVWPFEAVFAPRLALVRWANTRGLTLEVEGCYNEDEEDEEGLYSDEFDPYYDDSDLEAEREYEAYRQNLW